MDGFLGCKHAQLVHIVFIQQYLQAGLHRYILNPVTVTVFHSCLGLPLPMCSTLYLALFNSMRFSSTHLSNPSTSLRMASFPFSLLAAPLSLVSYWFKGMILLIKYYIEISDLDLNFLDQHLGVLWMTGFSDFPPQRLSSSFFFTHDRLF